MFLLVALSIYGAAGFYVFRRSTQALAGTGAVKSAFIVLFVCLFLAYPIGRLMFSQGRNGVSVLLMRTGSIYLAMMLMLFMWAAAVDLVRMADHFLHFFPAAADAGGLRIAAFAAAWISTLLIIAAGSWNAAHLRVANLEIDIDKNCGARKELRIAAASDIHLGVSAGAARLERIVDMIEALSPDIVLLPGDIVDESMAGRHEEKIMAAFARLKPPLGIYAVTGNHETYSGLQRNIEYLERFGIKVLRDEAVLVDGSFYVVGRSDPSVAGHGKARVTLAAILEKYGVNKEAPVLLIDHQPIKLEEAARAGIDLQISGHTHAGQLFPLNLINRRMYEKNWGYLRKGNTHYYVTSGAGTWGPPVRTGSRSEIVFINLRFR